LQVAELRKSERKLQEEVNSLYKEKAKLAEDYVAATRQLQIVRDNFEQHDRVLTERSATIKDLKLSKKELAAQMDHLKDAHAEAVQEMQVPILPPTNPVTVMPKISALPKRCSLQRQRSEEATHLQAVVPTTRIHRVV
jgi:DNA repair exonuclease SbcCD ATPase subunit